MSCAICLGDGFSGMQNSKMGWHMTESLNITGAVIKSVFQARLRESIPVASPNQVERQQHSGCKF